MAIIYTYPVKTTPADEDKILISDSEDNNKTKSVTIEDIRSATVSGVSSIIAGDNITLPSGGTGDVTIDSLVYTGQAGITVELDEISVDLKADSGLVIDNQEVSINLSASAIAGTLGVKDGGSGAATFTAGFLKADGVNAFTTVADIDLTTDVTEALPVGNGGTGTSTLTSGGILKGNGTSAVTADGDINDLASAQYSTASNGSLYLGNVPSGLSGNPTSNVVIGNSAGNALTTAASNTFVGERSGDIITTGGFNTFVGAGADSAAAGNRSGIAIGANATAGDGAIAIGRSATAADSQLALGSASYNLETSATAGSVLTYLIVSVNGTTYHLPLHDPNP